MPVEQTTPTPNEWHGREVAATWPEGSVVAVKISPNDKSRQRCEFHIHNRWKAIFIDDWDSCYVEFALLELPRKDGEA